MNDWRRFDLVPPGADVSAPDDFASVLTAHYGGVVLAPQEEELMRDGGMI